MEDTLRVAMRTDVRTLRQTLGAMCDILCTDKLIENDVGRHIHDLDPHDIVPEAIHFLAYQK